MFDDLLLTEQVVVALRTAATTRVADQPLGTSDVLLSLMRSDVSSPWDYVTLHTGSYDKLTASRRDDPKGQAVGRWEGVPLTPALTAALGYADELARGYRMSPVPAGLLALALVAEPESGATRTMLDGTELTHVELVDLVHEHLLAGELVDSALFPPWAQSATPTEKAAGHGRELLATGSNVDWSGAGAGAFELLRSAARRADAPLRKRLATILFEEDDVFAEVHMHIDDLADEPAAAVIDRARDRFDIQHPGAAHIIAAATVDPSEKVRRFCWFLGLDPSEVAALASTHALGDKPRSGLTISAVAVLGVIVVLHLFTTGLVIADVLDTRQWLKLGLVWAAWVGFPNTSIRAGLVSIGLLGWLVGPIAAAVQLVSVVLDIPYARAERQAFWGQTGVRLSLRKYRRHVVRAKEQVPRMQALRQRSTLTRRLARS